ncbi:hypothetical protein OAB01_01340 [Bacteroidia bacterium]|nr:hypothetical protein [Bacteroidia bacterium]
MSKWISEDDMMLFVKSGAHLESMKISNQIAAKIIVKRLVQNDFPTWKEAKKYIHSSK